jgi:hypothetical protein
MEHLIPGPNHLTTVSGDRRGKGGGGGMLSICVVSYAKKVCNFKYGNNPSVNQFCKTVFM